MLPQITFYYQNINCAVSTLTYNNVKMCFEHAKKYICIFVKYMCIDGLSPDNTYYNSS